MSLSLIQGVNRIFLDNNKGESHSMALTDAGQAYYWGSIGDVKSQRDPKLIETLVGRHIKTIAAGGSHSLFTT